MVVFINKQNDDEDNQKSWSPAAMTTNRVSPLNGNRANELCLALHGDEDVVVLVFTQQKTLGYFMLDLHMSSLTST